MSERKGLSKLTRRAREFLAKVIAGVRVKSISPVCPSEPRKILPQANPVLGDYQFSTSVSTATISLGFPLEDSISHLPSMKTEAESVPVNLDPTIVSTPRYRPEEMSLKHESCEIPDQRARSIGSMDLIIKNQALEFDQIDGNPGVLNEDILLPSGVPGSFDISIDASLRAGGKQVSNQPMSINPLAWDQMDKDFILASWDFLRMRAKLQLGYNPGRELVMKAIFRPVDFSVVDGISYDLENNRLFLKIKPQNGNKRLKKRPYAVIIGVVKGTEQVLQVPVSLDRY